MRNSHSPSFDAVAVRHCKYIIFGFILIPEKEFSKMKRAMVMSVRATVDKKTNENVVYVTLFDMGNRNKDGVIFTARSSEAVKTAFANEVRNPEKYAKYKALTIGSLCTMDLGVNDFDGKVYVSNLELVKKSPYSLDDIYKN